MISKLMLTVGGSLLFVSQFARFFSSTTHMTGQNVLLVTAHPDDETMFFGPTLMHILDPSRNNSVHLLCLSNGDSEGIGDIREQELYKSVARLGLPQTNVSLKTDERLPDSMAVEWESGVVAEHVTASFDEVNPQTVITFDKDGVSGHINHRAVYAGVLEASARWAPKHSEFSMMTLYSVPIWRKYLFSVDAVLARLIRNMHLQYHLIMSSTQYHHISSALVLHESQMTWYRQLWRFFSRYMLVNDLGEVDFGRALRSTSFESEAKSRLAQEWENRERGTNVKTSVGRPERKGNKQVTRHKPVASQIVEKAKEGVIDAIEGEKDVVKDGADVHNEL